MTSNPQSESRIPQTAANASRFAALRTPAAVALFVLTFAAGLTLDLWSKSHAWRTLTYPNTLERDPASGHLRVDSDTYAFLPGWLHFKVTVNEGAVFGLGQGNQMLFAVVSIAAILFLTYLFATSGRRWFYQFVLGMLLAGVLGNLYDRMVYRYVRDMLYMLPGRHWPGGTQEIFPWIFNVADSLLCVGVGLMIVYSLFAHEPEAETADKPEAAAAQPAQS
jgi:signal peptidase II